MYTYACMYVRVLFDSLLAIFGPVDVAIRHEVTPVIYCS
jgi:hypothetical protein